MSMRAALVLAATLVVCSAGGLFAQGFQGGLRGSIKDAGGVVPGVEITLTNEQTNIKRSTVTNERGEYAFANVDPGTYGVKAALQGYKTVDRGDIRVATQSFLVLDLTLEIGAITESVTVTGQSPLIETANASQGAVLDSETLQTLPAPGRAAFLIGVSIPTVIPSGDAQFNRQQDQSNASLLSLGGGTRRGNNYTLDGVPITDITNRAVANPTIEALDDVKVQVHTYDAEMGRTGGGVFNTTLKSGTNSYRGTGFFQTRPVWGQGNNYFGAKAGRPKPESTYYLGGGGFGGPIVKNRTFFWFSSEDYHDAQTRNVSQTFPTAAERTGDFSRLTNSRGQPVIIYDPLTRLPFPGNVIPASRINPIAVAITKYLPLPDIDLDNGSTNYSRVSIINNKFEQEYAIKGEHKFTDKVSLTGFYLYNNTDEPDANYFGRADQTEPTRFADPADYVLKRRPQIVAINNTWIPSDNSVLALRYGWTRFPDNSTMTIDFDPSTLGFSQTFLGQIKQTGVPKFPNGDIAGYSSFGAIAPNNRTYKSWGANGSYSKFVGTHTFKIGADYRRIGIYFFNPDRGSGSFQFDREFTSANGNNNSDLTSGNGFATFLLGYPSASSSRQTTMPLTTPLDFYINYYGGYWQDDWRVSSKLTLNYGLRLEHEDGMREVNNNFTVGFDPTARSALSSVIIPADPVAGTPARQVAGGLMYAGVDGNKTYQGNPPKAKWSPRVGVVYSLAPSLVVRGGYGIFWSPWNYPGPNAALNNYGQVGYSQNTVSPQTPITPTITLNNPLPSGLVQPLGNSLGLLTGVGTTISYIDQNRTAPRVQQYSVDLQKELPGQTAITFSYVGARGDHLPLGGTSDTQVNINQVDPKYLSLGSALTQQLPNPFFGVAAAGPLASQTTLTRAQLLRPFPQFLNINERQVSEGRNRYNAGIVELIKRVSHGIGGRFSYTYSVLKDNQIGETNFFSTAGAGLPLNNYNYIAGSPYFNPMIDYGYSILDVPHRVILAPIAELPFGHGRRWGNKSGWVDVLAGGWTISALVNLQSGFPIGLDQSDNTGLFGGAQRPNVVPGVDLKTAGSHEDRLASADHPTATWINPLAFTTAPPYTFGTAPRTTTELRTPGQQNVDASFMKNFRLGGSKTAQVKIEVLNLFNRVTARGFTSSASSVGTSSFGQITRQSGFMRLTQIMFRYSF